MLVGVSTTNAGTPNFTVTTTSAADDPTGSDLTATYLPQTNQVLKIVTDQGEMDFELFNNYTPATVAHIVSLVNSGTYTSTSFYRVISDFMDQGGSGGTGSDIPVELNSNLRFTSSGLLAMANNGEDGNSSEFFVTNPDNASNGFLDFRYTIFGKLIAGDNVRAAIASTPVTTNTSSGENSQPVTPITIESASVTTETTGGVLQLSALSGATFGDDYTVTVNDGLGGSQTFKIKVGFDAPMTLSVGSGAQPLTTGKIEFNSSDPVATAAAMQSALQALGIAGATVAVDASSTAANLMFDVTFTNSEPPIVANASSLPVTFSNSVSASTPRARC